MPATQQQNMLHTIWDFADMQLLAHTSCSALQRLVHSSMAWQALVQLFLQLQPVVLVVTYWQQRYGNLPWLQCLYRLKRRNRQSPCCSLCG